MAPAVAAQLVIAAGAAPEGGADPTQFLSQYTSGSLEDKAAARKQHEGDALEALKAGYSGNSFAGILAARLGSMSKAAIDLIVTNNRIKGEIKAATGRDTYYRPPAVSLHDEALGQREKPIADPAFVTRNPNGDREAHAQMLKLNNRYRRREGRSLPQKPPSSIINSNGPLSNPTPAVRPWPWERVFMPRTGPLGWVELGARRGNAPASFSTQTLGSATADELRCRCVRGFSSTLALAPCASHMILGLSIQARHFLGVLTHHCRLRTR